MYGRCRQIHTDVVHAGVVLLLVCGLRSFAAAVEPDPNRFKPIFDGETLDGWKGNSKFWRIADGAITGESTPDIPCKENEFLTWQLGDLDDFELLLEYRIGGDPAANSGIQFRSQTLPNGHVIGYQADIDSAGKWVGALYDEHGRGLLAPRGTKTVITPDGEKQTESVGDADALFANVKQGDWNEYHIIARGPHLTLKVNGETTAEVIDNQESKRELSGVLAVQLHAGPPSKVQFRNIRLKRLKLEDRKKIVFLAGPASHGYGAHEHNAGCRLLAKALNEGLDNAYAVVYSNSWPPDPTALDNADAIVIYADGGERHMANNHLNELDRLMKSGVGMACFHYGVEVPKGATGDRFLDWIGGYFETYYSLNPHWVADFTSIPTHPITRGVEPFTINDEWYYHMRFPDEMEGVVPILSAAPPDETRIAQWGKPRGGNPIVAERKGMAEHVAWAHQRPDGGRGFGFTGGHTHANWGDDNFRKVALNAIAWVAGLEVPEGGVPSKTPTQEDLEANQDELKPTAEKK